MQLQADPELKRFRAEIRQFIDDVLPADMKQRVRDKVYNNPSAADQQAWMAILHKHGRSVPHWPVEHGGCGWTPMQLFVFNEELIAADAPEFDMAGSSMLGPVLYTFGSDYLKQLFLPMIREGRVNLAQGFSEPGSGSDLASLRTYAELRGDKYVVNGQKIWTSGAAHSEWGFFLVRTDKTVKPQRGISFLLIKMDTPGLTVRPIPQINGEAHVCEVFLENVEVPADQLIGEPGMGWTYAKFLLEHERTSSSFIYWSKRELVRIRQMAQRELIDGAPASELPSYRARIAKIDADLRALEWAVLRVLAREETGYPEAAAASVLKLCGSALQQAISTLEVDLLGAKSARYFPPSFETLPPNPLWPAYTAGRTAIALILRAATIYGGTREVQKNILAKLAYGL